MKLRFLVILFVLLNGILFCNTLYEDKQVIDSIKWENYELWQTENDINYFEYDSINYLSMNSYEKIKDVNLIKSFIKNYSKDIKKNMLNKLSFEELFANLYTIDINSDGLYDIIYNGIAEIEGSMIKIYMNKGNNKFARIFHEYQNFIGFKLQNNRLESFKIIDIGCCAESHIIEREYKMKEEKGKVSFIEIYKIGYELNTEVPKYKSTINIQFLTKSEITNLRTDSYLLDSVDCSMTMRNAGNVLATYSNKSKGKVLGYKIYKNTGKVWLYVAMLTNNNNIFELNSARFERDFNEIRGWVKLEDTDLDLSKLK